MKKTTFLFLSLALILGISSCKDDEAPSLGEAPTSADAAFTYAATAENANTIDFTATNSGFTYKWDFGNALLGEGMTAQSSYPNKGTYTVTLTVFNSGGSASSSQDIVIAEDDITLLDNPLYTLLTGGIAGSGSKTWVIDSTRAAHMGVGPEAGTWPEWWSADPLNKANTGLYSDRYTFKLSGFKFDHITNGLVFLNNDQMANFPGAYDNSDDASAPFENQLDETWTLTEGEDTMISISGSAFIGFFSGVREYRVETINENELTISYTDAVDATLRWYIRLVPEDFPVDNGGGGGGGGGGNTSGLALPFDFEGDAMEWTTFGGSTYGIVANPDMSGINTSANVLETLHGDQTWAGLFVDLKDPLDFTNGSPNLTVKVWAPAAGLMRMKLENIDDTGEFVEKDVNVPTANTWVEVSIDFSDAAAGKFARVVLFPGWDVANAGTFYLDDIKQN
jgi:PKD repeat protein